jgi:hypothetical protein
MHKMIEDIKFVKKVERGQRIPSTPQMKNVSFSSLSGIRKPIFIIFILAVLLAGTYFVLNKFSHVYIVITQKQETITLNNKEFTLSKNQTTPMHFEVMIIPNQEFKEVTLTETQNISTKAKGSIMLYNTYSTKAEKLTAGTYLADEKGKAYKLDKTVSIPGHGSITATITAFLPGVAYNGTPSSFTITSFKNTSKFKKIYGTATSILSGGAEGLMYKGIVSNQTVSKADILKKVEVPPGYILYPDASTFSSVADQSVLSPTPNAKVITNSTLSAVLLKKDELSNALINNSEVELTNLDSLKFNFTNSNQTITKDLQIVSFTLTGDVHAVWHPDINALKESLLGVAKNTTQGIFKQDVGIESATVKIFPLWSSYLPNDISKINITVH